MTRNPCRTGLNDGRALWAIVTAAGASRVSKSEGKRSIRPLVGAPPLRVAGDTLEEFRKREVEGVSHALDVDQTNVAAATFDVGQVGTVDANSAGQILLGQAKFLAPGTDGIAEAFANIRSGTPLSHCIDGRGV